jgi:hypothetical protein
MARALCMQPKIMLFDEPTSALDPEMVKEVPDTIVELASHIPEDHANPARWKGHLAKLQPSRSRSRAATRRRWPTSALALEFLVLRAARTDETLWAQWREVDLVNAISLARLH